jgi:anaerobic ribonucleoside-triphosphate reductase activating protein
MNDASKSEKMLNIAEMIPRTRALGPGLRAAVWVQGCPLHCKGCISPNWIPFRPANELSPEKVAKYLLSNPEIQGITISGGEPTAQAHGLVEMIKIARHIRDDLHIICFSGFTYESLQKRPLTTGILELLQLIDVLIDGPYIEGLNHGDSFPGSRNQRMISLSERPLPGAGPFELRKMEVYIRNGNVLAVGIPPLQWPAEFLPGLFQNHPLSKGVHNECS